MNPSVSVLKKILNTANRFMKFLHHVRPDEIPLMIFELLTKSRVNQIRAQKEQNGVGRQKRKYITERDRQVIVSKIDKSLRPVFLLVCYYGLRRNEILGLMGILRSSARAIF